MTTGKDFKQFYYFDPMVVDLAVLQKNAKAAALEGKEVTIHYHKRSETCGNKNHEYYPKEKTK